MLEQGLGGSPRSEAGPGPFSLGSSLRLRWGPSRASEGLAHGRTQALSVTSRSAASWWDLSPQPLCRPQEGRTVRELPSVGVGARAGARQLDPSRRPQHRPRLALGQMEPGLRGPTAGLGLPGRAPSSACTVGDSHLPSAQVETRLLSLSLAVGVHVPGVCGAEGRPSHQGGRGRRVTDMWSTRAGRRVQSCSRSRSFTRVYCVSAMCRVPGLG